MYRKSMQHTYQSRKIHWLFHTKLGRHKSNGPDLCSRYIASFIASEITKTTYVSLMEVDREKNEVVYKIDESVEQDQAYRIPFPKDGALDLTDVRDPNDPHHFLSVARIAPCAFVRYSGLTSIVVPEDLRVICDEAFQGCDRLKSVVILGGISDMLLSSIFSGCKELQHVTCARGFYKCVAKSLFSDSDDYDDKYPCINFMSCDGGLVRPAYSRNVVIPDGVTHIYTDTFKPSWCSIESVVMPESLTKIDQESLLRRHNNPIGQHEALCAVKCSRQLYNNQSQELPLWI